jgi:hypothetical protein
MLGEQHAEHATSPSMGTLPELHGLAGPAQRATRPRNAPDQSILRTAAQFSAFTRTYFRIFLRFDALLPDYLQP